MSDHRQEPIDLSGSNSIEFDEASIQHLEFNVMSERPVRETLHVRKYVIKDNEITAHFDREYFSSMLNSPSHLIFLSSLVQMQKLGYVWACHKFGFPYGPDDPERLKIWPFDIRIEMPALITEENDLKQRLVIERMFKVAEGHYWFRASSDVGENLVLTGSVRVLLLPQSSPQTAS